VEGILPVGYNHRSCQMFVVSGESRASMYRLSHSRLKPELPKIRNSYAHSRLRRIRKDRG
jgi:hypothetical protein